MVLPYTEGRSRGHARASESLSRGSVQVRGESLFYEASGSPEEGPTLLFLHESGGTAATWNGQITGLAERARCLAMDLPGHGRSEGIGYEAIADYRRAVLAFLDALAIRWPVVLAGVCLGAAVAVDAAIHAPERVQGLILAGVSTGGRACQEVLSDVARGEAPEQFVAGMFGSRASQRLVAEHLKRWRLTSPLVRHGDLTAMSGYPLPEALRSVTHPVLLVTGEHDRRATSFEAYGLVADLPDACVVEIPGAGCLSMAEQPAAFNRFVNGFLSGLGPTSPVMPVVRAGGYRRY